MPLTPGEKLGPYEILAPIGAGGMGEVFKGNDTRLGRAVAIKVSKTEFSERFEREARAISALNHPHICQLYDVGPNYLVMEYIDGAPLKGPLPIEKALEYAGQIASALDAAHSKNITHRDLKPANILVTKSAGVKLLDFGLAKIGSPVAVQVDQETATMGLTMKGQILGTLLYMSPEQINGQEAGPSSDIFSFGLVLYEMLTGKRAFEGSTPASVMAAILERPAPSITDVAPAALNRVLKRCLEKDPANRWQSARDLRAALDLVSPEPALLQGAAKQESNHSFRTYLFAGTALVATLAAVGIGAVHFGEQPVVREPLRFEILPPEGQTFSGAFELSPDGRNLAYVAEGADGIRRVWVRPMNSVEAKAVAERAGAVQWSPDSRSLLFASAGKMQRLDIAAGRIDTVFEGALNAGLTSSWNQGGIILARRRGSLVTISAAGGAPVELPHTEGGSNPYFLPDGKHFLFSGNDGKNGIFVGTLDGDPSPKRLGDLPQSNFAYAPMQDANDQSGYLLFMRDSILMAQRFDPNKLELSGEAVVVINGVARGGAGYGFFSVSKEGSLAFRPGSRGRATTWFDRQGRVLASFPLGGSFVALAPGGTKAAISSFDSANDIFVLDLLRKTPERFTLDPGRDTSPVWSPDGSQIAFGSNRGGSDRLYVKPANGASTEEVLFQSSQPVYPNDWSRDGKYLVFSTNDPKTKWDLWTLNLSDRKAKPFLQTEGDQVHGQISPDGRWIAYDSNESGMQEIYVRSFPDGNARWLVARGEQPRWRRDGRELFFRGGQGLASVEVLPGPAFQAGLVKRLFEIEGPGPGLTQNAYYDVTDDGQRFLVTTLAPEVNTGPITVVLNWQAMLKK